MFLFTWIRKWCEQRHLRLSRKERDDEHTRLLHLTLGVLQRVMDPLGAAQAYNNRFCPLTRLPEELLLCILDFLDDDVVTLKCLRMASRIFLRLIGNKPVHVFESNFEFSRLLRRDGRCKYCRRWNDGHKYLGWDFCCRFHIEGEGLREARCLAEEGSIRLCEHVHIHWAQIKAHIESWREKQPYQSEGIEAYRQKCLDSFRIECHDASHDVRCTLSEAPTWPRASLATFFYWNDYRVVLCLEWAPHARVDSLAPTMDGQIPAFELRALFRRLRQRGPVDTLLLLRPPYRLREMACFASSFPISYQVGDSDAGKQPLPRLSAPSEGKDLQRHCRRVGDYRTGRNSCMVEIGSHYLTGISRAGISQQCLVVKYMKDILVCRLNDLMDPAVELTPTSPWLYAMDPETYVGYTSGVRALCKDKACNNYYERQKRDCLCIREEMGPLQNT